MPRGIPTGHLVPIELDLGHHARSKHNSEQFLASLADSGPGHASVHGLIVTELLFCSESGPGRE